MVPPCRNTARCELRFPRGPGFRTAAIRRCFSPGYGLLIALRDSEYRAEYTALKPWIVKSGRRSHAAYRDGSELMPRVALPLLCIVCASGLAAQDAFEIHVYEYEPMNRREYSLEGHLNLIAQGTPERDGMLLPTARQTHLTLEPTAGLSPNIALGFMFLSAWQPGYAPQFAGWRVLPHFYLPEEWLPVRVGFVAEFSFQNIRYEENSRRVELRPILDREFQYWQVVFNPVFERALHGPGTRHGWNFEPAVLLRWKRKKFSPSLEYYGGISSISAQPHAQPEVHQVFVGGDWAVKAWFGVNLGVGVNVGPRGPGLVLKSRFEWHWKQVPHSPGKAGTASHTLFNGG